MFVCVLEGCGRRVDRYDFCSVGSGYCRRRHNMALLLNNKAFQKTSNDFE